MIIDTDKIMEQSSCPVCLKTAFKKRFTKKDKDFWQCTNCGLERIYPLPTLKELEKYYDESYTSGMYKDFADAGGMKDLTAQQRLKEISPYCSTGRWLDVGCANGVFVANALKKGIDAEGIDLSTVAVEQGRQHGLPLHNSTIEDWKPSYQYDTVVAFDILEHVLDPFTFIENIYNLLTPDGTIILSMPNQQTIVRKLMGKNWYFYIPEEHMHYFNPKTITQLLERANFDIIDVKRTYKPLTFNYSMIQFKEYNPLIFRLMDLTSKILPQRLKDMTIPLYIGEMVAIARKKK